MTQQQLARIHELIRSAKLRADELDEAKMRLDDALQELEDELEVGALAPVIDPQLLQSCRGLYS